VLLRRRLKSLSLCSGNHPDGRMDYGPGMHISDAQVKLYSGKIATSYFGFRIAPPSSLRSD